MPEETKEPTISEPLSLEKMFEQEEQEIQQLLKEAGVNEVDVVNAGGETETQPPPTETIKEVLDETPPAGTEEAEKKPVDDEEKAKSAEEVPKKEEEKPPIVEAKPPEVKPEPKKDRIPVWKALRDAQRRADQLAAENAELKRAKELPKAEGEAAEDIAREALEDDPLTRLENNQKNLDKRLADQAEQIRQKQIADTIKDQETHFSKDHPDYDQALNYIVERARVRFADTGELEDKMEEVLKAHQPVIERVMATKGIANPTDDDVYQTAEDIAFAVLFEQERQKFVARHLGKGKSVAEAAYRLAQSEGYAPKAAAIEPAKEVAPAPKPKTDTPQERVQRQAKMAAATQSLSAMQNSGPTRNQVIKSKSEFMKMTPEAQDKLIEEMEEKDPDWLLRLPD